MRAFRLLVWPLGLGLLALTAPLTWRLPDTTYGGSAWWLLWLEVAAAFALLTVALLRPLGVGGLAVAVSGATWLVPELAGWTSGPAVVSTVADAWSHLLPALIVIGLLASSRAAVVLVAAGGLLGAGARLLLVDPFLDPDCWRRCDHNPVLITGMTGAGRWLEAAGVVLTASATLWAAGVSMARGRGRLLHELPEFVGASVLAAGLIAPAVLRLVRPEAATHPAYLVCFLLAQAGAVALALVLIRDRLGQWRLSRRLARLAGALESAPPPGALAGALRDAVADHGLQVRYWAPARGIYVNAEGESAEATTAGDRQVTLVTRRGQPVAALTHSEGVSGNRLDRALGAALRLALENDQLRAAALAELRELQLSRSRIVERAQLERRRLERNLHDGAQQRVVSLALLVRMLGQRLNGDGQPGLAARAEALTRATVEELRRVARGIYPAVLADAGLSGAVLDLAESSTDLPVSLDTLPPGQYTGPVETTAYLVIAAAIAEARRSDATQVSVSGHERDGRLVIDVRDDAAPGRRTAVTELADQVRALAGEIMVEPESGGGTRVRLELPCGW